MSSIISANTENDGRGTPQTRSAGLVRARRDIQAARNRNSAPAGDGGGTGRSDGND
ncbi:hypothetical protein ABZ714_12905 [Streptomyces sp. NPDC006798]|uniref:hypothetical protein n=1 Tax=Streptomyces sp. NPDC006798 TaxID=3155462 RepID=UPI0033DAD7C9